MTCDHCSGRFIAGMVGMTPWPQHVCPDGTTNAPSSFGWRDNTPAEWQKAVEGVRSVGPQEAR